MKNKNNYIVFDFETGGIDPYFHEAIQVAGKAYTPDLKPVPITQGGEFNSLMKPLHFDRLTEGALNVNKIKVSDLENAPDQKIVWEQFCDWVGQFNPKKNKWTAPIAVGKNIRSFDLVFVEQLNKVHKITKPLFALRPIVDLEDFLFQWFENSNDLKNYKMDEIREYMGMSLENAHDALVDVRQTGDLVMRFLKLHRRLKMMKNTEGQPLIKFEGCCSGA